MKTRILILMSLLAAGTCVKAQQALKSAYFLEGYSYRHQMNPAFAPERKYVSFPFLGNMNIRMNGNVGLSNFLFESKKPGYDLTTFMSSEVNSKEFLDGLKNNNKVGTELNMQLFSFGRPAWGGFFTFDIGIHSDLNVTMPKDVFAFMKNGMGEGRTEYSLSNIGMMTRNYMQIAPGYSRRINDKLSVGGKVKILLGMGYASARYDRMDITLSDEEWYIQSQGHIETAVNGYGLDFKKNDNGDMIIDGFSSTDGSLGLTGFGLAFDLGATYQLLDDLQLSASITDLGFMSWKNITRAEAAKSYSFKGFENIVFDENDPKYDGNSIDDQMEKLGEDLQEMFLFTEDKDKTSTSSSLAATLNIGAEYTFPLYRNLTFGFLSSTRISGKFSASEGRFFANVSPTKWFDASVNYAISTYGSSFGWIINFHPKGFNLFIGSDSQFFELSPQFIPVKKANMNISFGINFPVGDLY